MPKRYRCCKCPADITDLVMQEIEAHQGQLAAWACEVTCPLGHGNMVRHSGPAIEVADGGGHRPFPFPKAPAKGGSHRPIRIPMAPPPKGRP